MTSFKNKRRLAAEEEMNSKRPQFEKMEQVSAQLKNESGEVLGSKLNLPINITVDKLQHVCNVLLKQEDTQPYSFYVDGVEITGSLDDALSEDKLRECEYDVDIVYQPQAIFKVRAVTRCSSTLPGHAEAVLFVKFSPDGRYLASGSGDKTVRFWDINTETPQFTCEGHKSVVLYLAWSACGRKLASGCKDGKVCVWNPLTGKQMCRMMDGHKRWIMCLAWKPLHLDGSSRYLASASKDTTIRIWDTFKGQTVRTLSGHTQCVTCIRWSGSNLIYSSSQDRTIKVWRADDGVLCRTLEGHGHWVNQLALNTDYVMRTGPYEPAEASLVHKEHHWDDEELSMRALERYNAVINNGCERMVSSSDDHTMWLWEPEKSKHCVTRLVGHQQTVNEAAFSPDGRLIASASFDKSVKIWDGATGKFLWTLRGHVQRAYLVSWSADSRLLVSCSADSTVKVWDIKAKDRKLLHDLPGHEDQVLALDWSPDGQRVASGGRDKVLKIWRK